MKISRGIREIRNKLKNETFVIYTVELDAFEIDVLIFQSYAWTAAVLLKQYPGTN